MRRICGVTDADDEDLCVAERGGRGVCVCV